MEGRGHVRQRAPYFNRCRRPLLGVTAGLYSRVHRGGGQRHHTRRLQIGADQVRPSSRFRMRRLGPELA